MTKVLLIAMLLVSCSVSAAVWFPGSVILASGKVVTGEIARQSDDQILFRSGADLMVLPAHRVSSYRFYDDVERINRKFVSMAMTGTGLRFQYFEKVMTGSLTVLRTQHEFRERFDEAQAVFDYYILKGDDLSPLLQFRRKYYASVRSSLEQHELDVSKLDPNEAADVINLIRMYNQLPAGPIAVM